MWTHGLNLSAPPGISSDLCHLRPFLELLYIHSLSQLTLGEGKGSCIGGLGNPYV